MLHPAPIRGWEDHVSDLEGLLRLTDYLAAETDRLQLNGLDALVIQVRHRLSEALMDAKFDLQASEHSLTALIDIGFALKQ